MSVWVSFSTLVWPGGGTHRPHSIVSGLEVVQVEGRVGRGPAEGARVQPGPGVVPREDLPEDWDRQDVTMMQSTAVYLGTAYGCSRGTASGRR